MKVGLAFSTYTNDNTDLKRYTIIKRCFKSIEDYLKKTKLDIYAVIVVDGSIPDIHKSIIDDLSKNINIYYKLENGGVSKVKNTGIRLILENNCEIGFLLDDDVLIKENCFEEYIDKIIKCNIPHMCYCQIPELVHPKRDLIKMNIKEIDYNGEKLLKHGGEGVGCLLTFTKDLIDKIGYFRVMDGKYGYEHINFTLRCIFNKIIPHAFDLINSYNFIDHIGFEPIGYNKYSKCHSIEETYRKTENKKNKNNFNRNLHIKEKLIE